MKAVKPYNKTDLRKYLQDDFILAALSDYPQDAHFASQRWLERIPAKRLIYADIYGDLLKTKGKRILDIGGGFCGLSRQLISRHNYTLVDQMHHDGPTALKKVETKLGKFWQNYDWKDFQPQGRYDYIIANDIFPNVDQRLESFIRKYRPHAKKLILTLTCHENDLSYRVKRVDADEILTVVPWNAAFTGLALSKALGTKIKLVPADASKSLFGNGRTVYKVEI